MGSGQNGSLTGIDLLSVISLYVSLKNLDLNIDQNDIAEQTKDINQQADKLVSTALTEIHNHLQEQDKKIDKILKIIGETNEKN